MQQRAESQNAAFSSLSSPEWVEWEAARALARSGEEVELTGEEPRPVELGRGRGRVSVIEKW